LWSCNQLTVNRFEELESIYS